MARKLFLTAGALLAAATLAISQTPSKSPTPQSAKTKPQVAEEEEDTIIKGGVDLVNVLATVRNKNGALVSNLEKTDFKIYEDGKEQEIRNFTRETDLPLTIGLVIDVSGSVANLIPEERRAGGQFFETVLRPKDLAFIISFGKDSELLQDATSSPRLLQKGLDELRPNAPVGGGGIGRVGTPGTIPSTQAGTVLYDAVYLAANERLRRESGRKVIILITDGEDTGSQVSRDKAIEAAQKSDAIIYSIYVYDRNYGGNEGVLKRMSEETGGRVFSADRGNLTKVFHDIEQEMRTQYSIDFAPKNGNKDGSYRKLDIRVANKDYKVQARKGYYALQPEN
jgi:VWFA-related protein